MKRHRIVNSELGWMPIYNNRPYWPLFKTRPEAIEYAKMKLGIRARKPLPAIMIIRRCRVTTTTVTEVVGVRRTKRRPSAIVGHHGA